MRQILIVCGKRPEETCRILREGVQAFVSLYGLDRPVLHEAGTAGVAVFGDGDSSADWHDECGLSGTAIGAPVFSARTFQPSDRQGAEAAGAWAGDAEGQFALVVRDPRCDEIHVATDRLGSLHLFETTIDGAAVVSTSGLALARLGRRSLDPAACRIFLTTGTPFGPQSLFAGVRKLEPAQIHSYSAGQKTGSARYWDIREKFYDRARQAGAVEATAEALVQAMDSISATWSEPLLDLTGGYDSRIVLAAMLKTGRHFEVTVSGPADSGDVQVAKALAQEFGLKLLHHSKPELQAEEIWAAARQALLFTDGQFDVMLYYATMLAHQSNAGKYSTSVNGSNGEITKGYWYELLMPRLGKRGAFDASLVASRRFAYNPEPREILAGDFEGSVADELAARIRECNAGIEELPNTSLMDNAYLSMRMRHWQGSIASSSLRIWPIASPFISSKVMGAVLATPGTQRARLRFTTRLMESLNPRLASLPLEQGYPAQPVRWSNLHRFALPLAREYAPKVARKLGLPGWSAGLGAAPDAGVMKQLGEIAEVRAMLDPTCMASGSLYRPDPFRAWVRQCLSEGGDESARLGRVLTLELAARAADG